MHKPPSMRLRHLGALACIILLFSPSASAIKANQTLPTLIGRNIHDNNLFATSKLDKQPSVINFFWIECLPCIQELPHLAQLEQKHPNVQFIAIHSGINTQTLKNYDIKAVSHFISTVSAAPKTIIWSSARTLKDKFNITTYPTTLLVDSNQRIAGVLFGYNESNTLHLEQWLNQQSN